MKQPAKYKNRDLDPVVNDQRTRVKFAWFPVTTDTYPVLLFRILSVESKAATEMAQHCIRRQ